MIVLIDVLSCPQLIPKNLIKREDKEISTKELRKLTLRTSEVSFDEGINIKRGRNDQGFDLLFE